MSASSESISQQLRQTLAPSQLEVIDESYLHAGHAGSGGATHGSHFRVRIASQLFTGKRRVEQHRLVYDALAQFMAHGVHALAIEVLSEV